MLLFLSHISETGCLCNFYTTAIIGVVFRILLSCKYTASWAPLKPTEEESFYDPKLAPIVRSALIVFNYQQRIPLVKTVGFVSGMAQSKAALHTNTPPPHTHTHPDLMAGPGLGA